MIGDTDIFGTRVSFVSLPAPEWFRSTSKPETDVARLDRRPLVRSRQTVGEGEQTGRSALSNFGYTRRATK